MDKPKISVIIPVYNVENYINRCLDSLIQQSFKDFEVILIDDGSPDKAGLICDEYAKKDSRFKVFHIENGGVSAARNLGLSKAKGEWITFVDSDDWLEEKYLEHFYTPISKEVDMVACGIDRVDDNYSKKQLIFKTATLDVFESFKQKNFHYCLYTCGKLYRASIIKDKNLSFKKNLSLHEDTLFIFEYLIYTQKVHFVDFIEYKYYLNPNSLTSRFNSFSQEYDMFFLGLKSFLRHYKDNAEYLSYLKMVLKDSIVSMYRPKVAIKDRKIRLSNMKRVYNEQAEMVDALPNKTILKRLRKHHSLLDIFLSMYYSPSFNFMLVKLRNICLGRKKVKKNETEIIYY